MLTPHSTAALKRSDRSMQKFWIKVMEDMGRNVCESAGYLSLFGFGHTVDCLSIDLGLTILPTESPPFDMAYSLQQQKATLGRTVQTHACSSD